MPVRRILPLAVVAVVAVVCLAGCGGSHDSAQTTTSAPPSPKDVLGPGGHTLYQGTDWAVVQRGTSAAAVHLVHGRWRVDRSGRVKVEVLGPQPHSTATRTPQVAVEVRAPAPLVETALWVDGRELLEKGGGSPTRGTVYGAPAKPLNPGRHVAVGYGRTGATGTAVAWAFTVG